MQSLFNFGTTAFSSVQNHCLVTNGTEQNQPTNDWNRTLKKYKFPYLSYKTLRPLVKCNPWWSLLRSPVLLFTILSSCVHPWRKIKGNL